MNKTYKKLLVLIELVVTIIFGYMAIALSFSSLLTNFILIVIALYIFLQALGNVDELNGYNTGIPDKKQSTSTRISDDNDENSAGLPDEKS